MAVSKIYVLDPNEIIEKVEQAIVEHQFYNCDIFTASIIKDQKLILTKPLVDGSKVSRAEKELEASLSKKNIKWMKTLVLTDNFQEINFNYSVNKVKNESNV